MVKFLGMASILLDEWPAKAVEPHPPAGGGDTHTSVCVCGLIFERKTKATNNQNRRLQLYEYSTYNVSNIL